MLVFLPSDQLFSNAVSMYLPAIEGIISCPAAIIIVPMRGNLDGDLDHLAADCLDGGG